MADLEQLAFEVNALKMHDTTLSSELDIVTMKVDALSKQLFEIQGRLNAALRTIDRLEEKTRSNVPWRA